MFEWRVESTERFNLLYDEITGHYHVIGNLTAAMARNYVCKACGKGCSRDVTHTCDQTCSCCMESQPCVATVVRIPCADCDIIFVTRTVSPTIRGELEVRGPCVSASSNAGHAANSSIRANHTNAVSATVNCAART